MREIKFRGKRLDTHEWVYGWYVNKKKDKHQIVTSESIFPVSVKDFTVGQFTGLIDKNGVEIYDGDRILYSNVLERGEGIITFHLGFNIEWDLNTVVTSNPSLISPLFYFGCAKEIEVIGNIHDNPELIK
ncbi:hypothetical protein DYBT9275_02723 [Dyadobacter sp. CECT 9275]|uniref:YopX protein domain-containing protein n=1 Tax=Dyadobacter helix TaxID=2822344 RepID=A0A916JDK5_9BACT|nr:YopX family protein [Dyadobacter sp. CECT 9275]CAG5001697.1 hypothetical protein DYBT9275_02723 [Dyadobacter sp. CECT 9275]